VVVLIAIDGPSGAGKGTVARTIATQLKFRHVDTGAMYRAVAWRAEHLGINLADGLAVAGVAERAVFDLDGRVGIDGHDVVERRWQLIDGLRQRDMGRAGGVVMEGRDIGSVVFPEAPVKIYLDATPDERARRRARDTAHGAGQAGAAPDRVGQVAQALEARDLSDRTRAASPLMLAPDAVYIDTTGVSIDEVVAQVMDLVATRRRLP